VVINGQLTPDFRIPVPYSVLTVIASAGLFALEKRNILFRYLESNRSFFV
jgi:hypothetical protein